MIGLCGAHRVGKSTLAKAYAEKHKIPFVQTGVSKTYERLGMSPKEDYPFATRLAIQKEILKDCGSLYSAAGVQWITDRTPIDFLAYTLADVQRQNVSYTEAIELDRYISDCFDLCNRHFTTIIAVQPGIPLVEEEGKAPANPAYIEHLNTLVMGLIVSEKLEVPHYYLQRDMTNLEQRIGAVEIAIKKAVIKHQESMRSLFEGGISLH